MKITHPLIVNTAGLLATAVIRRWMATLDMRWALYDRAVDPALDVPGRRRIYLFWHEYILPPIDRRGHCNVTMLLSRHRDAEPLHRAARHLGFGTVRGSTFDGAAASLRELIAVARRSHLTITPDGPRGPRRVMSVGPIYLASKLGLPIIPMGYGYDRPWRINSWDRFAVPRPFSRCRAILGPEVRVPRRLDRDALEYWRREIERMMNLLTAEAEAWAESGRTMVGELPWSREVLRPGNFELPSSPIAAEPLAEGRAA